MKCNTNKKILGRLLTLMVIIHLCQRVSWVTMVNAMDNDGNNEQGEKGIKPSGDKKTNLRSFPTQSSLNDTEKLEQDNLENVPKAEQECVEATSSEDPKVKAGEAPDVSTKAENEYKHEEQPKENLEEEEALHKSEQIKRGLEGESTGSGPINETRDDEKDKEESSVLKSTNQETKEAQENTRGLDVDTNSSQNINKEKEIVSDEKDNQCTQQKEQVDLSIEQENKSKQKGESSLEQEKVDSKLKEEKDTTKDNNGTEERRIIDVSLEEQQYNNSKDLQSLVIREGKQHVLDDEQQASVSNEPQQWDNSEEQGSYDIEEQGSERREQLHDPNEQQGNNDIRKQADDDKQVEENGSESLIERFKKVVRKGTMVQSLKYPSFVVPEDVAENEVRDKELEDVDMCSIDDISQAQSRHKEYEDVYMDFHMEKPSTSSSKDEVEQGVQSTENDGEKVTLVCCTLKEGCLDSEVPIQIDSPEMELVMSEDGEALVMVDDGDETMIVDDHDDSKVVTQQPVRLPSPSEILNELDSILEEQERQDNMEEEEEDKENQLMLHQQLGIGCACDKAMESMGFGMVRDLPIKTNRVTVSDVGGVSQGKKHREQHGKSGEESVNSIRSSTSSKCSGTSTCNSSKKGRQDEEASNVVKKKNKGEERKKVNKSNRDNIVEGPDEMIDAVLGDNIRIIRSTAMLLNVWPVDYGNSRQVARVMNMEIVDEENLLGCYYRINVRGEEGSSIPMLIERSTGDEIMKIIKKKKMREEIGKKCIEIKIPERIRRRAIVMEQGKVINRSPDEEKVLVERGVDVDTVETVAMSTKVANAFSSTVEKKVNGSSASSSSQSPNTSHESTSGSYTLTHSSSNESPSASCYTTPKGDDATKMKTPDNKRPIRPMRPVTPSCYGGRKPSSTEIYSSTSTLSTAESTTSGSSEEQVLFERGAVGGVEPVEPKTPRNYWCIPHGFGRGHQKPEQKRPKTRLGFNKERRIKISPIATSKVRRKLEFLDEDDKDSEEKLGERGEDTDLVLSEMDETLNAIATSDSNMSSMVRPTSSGGARIMIGEFSDEDDEDEENKAKKNKKSIN